jgi:hypothetical protein
MARKRLTTLKQAAEAKTHRKVALILSVEADERLTIQARRRGISRSKLADEILAEQLRHISVHILTVTQSA